MADQEHNSSPGDEAEIVLQIRAGVAAQIESEAKDTTKATAIEINSKFVMECLDANELGDGILYAALHKDKFVFAKGSESWFAWDRHSWVRDEMDLAVSAVENVALRYAKEIEVLGGKLAQAMADGSEEAKKKQDYLGDRIDQVKARVKRLRKDSGRQNCLKFAHTNPVLSLAVRAADFDLNPWLLACANGVINLKTGELEPGRPEDYISKRAKASFHGLDGGDDFSFWEDALLSIYGGDEQIIKYMQRLYGYGITGLNIEHVFPVLFGRGRNGKGLVVEALTHVLGDYAGPVPAEMLLDGNRSTSAGGSSPEIMALKGLRLAIASETDEGRRFSAAKVKWLTGGDTLTGRGLYDKQLTRFIPSHLLMLLTNHKPNAPDTDFAFWERCILVPHKFSFVSRADDDEEPLKPNERKADKYLPDKLRSQADAILAWLVAGCIQWQKIGLQPPQSVREATLDYREDENYIGQFLDACCDQGEGFKANASELYEAFSHWYLANVNAKERFLPSQRAFGQKLQATGLFERKRANGVYHYRGVAVSSDYQAIMLASETKGDDRWTR